MSLDSYDSEGPHTPETDDSAEVKLQHTDLCLIISEADRLIRLEDHRISLSACSVVMVMMVCGKNKNRSHLDESKDRS